MPEDEDRFDTQNDDGVFEARNDFLRHDVAGNAGDEKTADGLIENQLHRHSGIRACEYRRKGLLPMGSAGPQYFEILLNRGELIGRTSLVPSDQGLDGFVG